MPHLLNAYQISIHPLRDTSTLMPLGNFDGAKTDIGTAFARFVEKSETWTDSSGNLVTLGAPEVTSESSYQIATVPIQLGESGVSSTIHLTNQDGEVSPQPDFTRTKDHAEFIRAFIVMRWLPSADRGFVVVHVPHGRALRGQFWTSFKDWFRTEWPDLKPEIDRAALPLAYRDLVEKGRVNTVTLIRQVEPEDALDGLVEMLQDESLGRLRVELTAPRFGLRKDRLMKAMDDEVTRRSILTFRGEDYEEAEITVTEGGRSYTINLVQDRLPRGGENVTHKLEFDEDDNPIQESVRVAALEYIQLLQATNRSA